MTLNEFLGSLPKDVAEVIGNMKLEEAINALPEPIWKILLAAVQTRFRTEIPKFPTEEEWGLWSCGAKIEAFTAYRARCGGSVMDAKRTFEQGKLETFTRDVFGA